LIEVNPELKNYLSKNKYDQETIDFKNNLAVIELNRALLLKGYNIKFWAVDPKYLCPAVPGRADYLHHLADLLNYKQDSNFKIFDLGVGANCIYPILGNSIYNWKFVCSDVNEQSVKLARQIVLANPQFRDKIKILLQKNSKLFFEGIVKDNDFYNACICNPPFFENRNQAERATVRKHQRSKKEKAKLNFGGQANEIVYKGGEKAFVLNLINESLQFKHNFDWFTCLVSKKSNLPFIYKAFEVLKISTFKKVEMHQGNKQSRFVAWKFPQSTL